MFLQGGLLPTPSALGPPILRLGKAHPEVLLPSWWYQLPAVLTLPSPLLAMGPCPLSRLSRGKQVLGIPSLQAEAGQLPISAHRDTWHLLLMKKGTGTNVYTSHGTTDPAQLC